MNCYSLTDGKVQEGIAADLFPLAEPAAGNVIRQAVIEVEVEAPVDAFLKNAEMLTCDEPYLFAYGIAMLRPLDGVAGKARKGLLRRVEPYVPDGSLLVSLDMTRAFGDRGFGDRSRLVCWSGSRGLLLSTAGSTALLDLPTGNLFVNRAGALVQEFRKLATLRAFARQQRELRLSVGRTKLLTAAEQ
jgi:hypothetical protein